MSQPDPRPIDEPRAADHRYDADAKGRPCQVILSGLDPENVCGRSESQHESSAWADLDPEDVREVRIKAVVGDPDPSDSRDEGLRLNVETIGIENGGTLALLYVINLPVAENPLTAAVKAMIDALGENYPEIVEVLASFADYVGFPMPESGK